MHSLKISKSQNTKADVFIKLQNSKSELIFACEKSLLIQYFEYSLSYELTEKHLIALSHFLAHELIKFFASKIGNELFDLASISMTNEIRGDMYFIDIDIEEEINQETPYCARIYSSDTTIKLLTQHILNKSILQNVTKVTGHPALFKKIKIDEMYLATLHENIRHLESRNLFLKCTYLIEGRPIEFYFDQNTVFYFTLPFLKNINENNITFTNPIAKLFGELFAMYLNQNYSLFSKNISNELIFIKQKEFLDFSLVSDQNEFHFFSEVKNKSLFIKILTSCDFQFVPNSSPKVDLSQSTLPFAVEIGVSYLNEEEYSSIAEGDILVFDKTCLDSKSLLMDKCVIHLNDKSLIASLQNDECQIIQFTRDW